MNRCWVTNDRIPRMTWLSDSPLWASILFNPGGEACLCLAVGFQACILGR